ncbi:helix-loop-helix DNA-binding domain-containing protein [Phthorimaea operculella]|nr:helix-loop-helix DNA-binding domain-containing protein [Phthorimaea operculella]
MLQQLLSTQHCEYTSSSPAHQPLGARAAGAAQRHAAAAAVHPALTVSIQAAHQHTSHSEPALLVPHSVMLQQLLSTQHCEYTSSSPAHQPLGARAAGAAQRHAAAAAVHPALTVSIQAAHQHTSHSARRPPPLNSVASEPALLVPHSVMLQQLLSTQHSQSLYKLNSSEEGTSGGGGAELPRSPVKRRQPSPGSDVMSPHQSLSPPTSPGSPRERAGSPGGGGSGGRRTHLHAEQKRRCNIKNGFDTLQALIPHLSTNPAAKVSKAAMLQKGAEYIKQLKAERNQIKEEMESLRQQIECLNNSISNCHSLLPATGAPVSRARAGRLREMFARHVANRTMHNWKYWLFSVVAAALVDSFSACVSCGSSADLVRTTLLWAEQHCSLVEMRPAVLNSLRVLCTSTDILTNPERLPEEARAAVAPAAGVKQEPS